MGLPASGRHYRRLRRVRTVGPHGPCHRPTNGRALPMWWWGCRPAVGTTAGYGGCGPLVRTAPAIARPTVGRYPCGDGVAGQRPALPQVTAGADRWSARPLPSPDQRSGATHVVVGSPASGRHYRRLRWVRTVGPHGPCHRPTNGRALPMWWWGCRPAVGTTAGYGGCGPLVRTAPAIARPTVGRYPCGDGVAGQRPALPQVTAGADRWSARPLPSPDQRSGATHVVVGLPASGRHHRRLRWVRTVGPHGPCHRPTNGRALPMW